MKPYTLTAAGKYIAFTTLLACFSLLSRAQTETPAGANASIGMLSGRKSGAQAKLAAVKDEIQTFTVAVLEPHNKDAAEQRSAMAALEAGGYDATSQASVNAYNQRLAELDAWGKRVEERRIRETPRYVDMKTREAEYTQNIEDLDAKIKELIRKYSPDCANNESMEAAVNCWATYFDGEEKRNALVNPVKGTRFFSNGVPPADADAFKTYRNDQLDKINSGINKTIVPPPPPPPPKGMIEKATDDAIDFFHDMMKKLDRYKSRRVYTPSNAVAAVRG